MGYFTPTAQLGLSAGGFLLPLVITTILGNVNAPEESSSYTLDDSGSALGPGTSVVQLSVALEVPDRDDDRTSILAALDRLASTARTDSRVGIQTLSSTVALEILRRKSFI